MSTQHVSLFSGTASGGDLLVAWAESTRWRRVVMSCRGGLRFAFYGRVSTEDYPKYGARLPRPKSRRNPRRSGGSRALATARSSR